MGGRGTPVPPLRNPGYASVQCSTWHILLTSCVNFWPLVFFTICANRQTVVVESGTGILSWWHQACRWQKRHLQSSADRARVVPHTHNTFGDNSFAAVCPCVWNYLPSHSRQNISYGQFKRQRKHFCLALTDHDASWFVTYLLTRALELLLLTYFLTYRHTDWVTDWHED